MTGFKIFALGRIAAMVILASAGLSGGAVACDNVFSTPSCPSSPPVAPSYYPPSAPRAASTSMNFELTSDYVAAAVKPAVETPNGQNGVHVRKVVLSEQGTGDTAVNLLTLTIVPWLRGTNGQQVEVSTRLFDLALKITPYLVTPATVPDQATRSRILSNKGDAGVVLWFDFSGLRDDGTGAQVTCTNSDIISKPVLVGILNQLGTQTPLVITSDKLESVAMTLLNAPAHITGVNVGSNGTLKLGFAFDNLPGPQAAAPFDPQPYGLADLYPGYNWDWNLDITQGFFTAALQSRINGLLSAQIPGAMVTGVTATFSGSAVDLSKNRIDLSINGTAGSICGTFSFTVTTTVMPHIGADPSGKSVLQLPLSTPNFDPGTGQGFKAFCYAVEQTFFGGISVATITAGGGSCGDVAGDPVMLASPSGGDTLYGTAVNTEYDFVILGRSTMLDQEFGVRQTVPPCTPPS